MSLGMVFSSGRHWSRMTTSAWPTACMPFVVTYQHFLFTSLGKEREMQKCIALDHSRIKKNCKSTPSSDTQLNQEIHFNRASHFLSSKPSVQFTVVTCFKRLIWLQKVDNGKMLLSISWICKLLYFGLCLPCKPFFFLIQIYQLQFNN